MKKVFLCLFFGLFFTFPPLIAQEFSFQMFFKDAQGNKDTLTIGYDPMGSRDTIISEFGEENISHIPFDSIFDVRITNQADIHGASWEYDYDLFHTKKKIVGDIRFLNIDIHAEHWPVEASWNHEIFDDPELIGSLFTALHEMFWWDSGWYYSNFDKVFLNNNDHVTFTPNYPDTWEDHPVDYDFFCYYTDNEGKPIATYWVALGDSALVTVSTAEIRLSDKTLVYPNPTTGKAYISNSQSVKEIIVFDTAGRPFFVENKYNEIDLGHLPDGLYLVKIIRINGITETQKVIKKDF